MQIGFWPTVRREIRRMGSRRMYLLMTLVVPVSVILFFVGLLNPGLPLKVPTAVVDLDHSPMSRAITRNLNATELVDISQELESYSDAMASIRRGEIYGFFIIPANFERDAVAGKKPTLEYYNNLTYFVPGTLTFKGFKTVAVTTAAGMVKSKLASAGLPSELTDPLLQPMAVQDHPIGNPWMSYSIYLVPSFCFGTVALLIMLMTVFSITMEIKNGTSPDWLMTARGHMAVAVAGKFLPHFIVWSVVGQFLLALMFGWCHFPCGSIWAMVVAMELFIIGCQAMGLLFSSIVPNPRMALILAALCGILSFSFLGFSFPVQSMYGPIAIFSYAFPCRYMFLIYIFSALNAFPLWYSRIYFAALIAFPLVCSLLLWRLKKACLNPVYVP